MPAYTKGKGRVHYHVNSPSFLVQYPCNSVNEPSKTARPEVKQNILFHGKALCSRM
jgi:hypothetical protein